MAGRRGFTLTELMISLVMVLLLVLAVSQIFRVTTTTIGKGNATSEVIRGLDAARIALQIDFTGTDAIGYSGFTDKTGILPADRQPAIIISSTSMPAFLGPRDMEGDNDYDPIAAFPFGTESLDSNNDGTDDLVLGPFNTGRRWFRLDSLSFFTGGEYESQTNLQPGGGFYGNTTSKEAWVWYGHARVFNGSGVLNFTESYLNPGEGNATSNPNNFFASQFVLLRTPMLLKAQYDHDGDSTTAITATDDDGNPIYFVRPDWNTQIASPLPAEMYPGGATTPPAVGPFEFENLIRVFDASVGGTPPYFANHANVSDGSTDHVIEDSRVDVAGVDAVTYRNWLSFAQVMDDTGTFSGAPNGPLTFSSGPLSADPPTWYNRIFARTTKNPQNQSTARFWINPLVLKPLDAGEASQATGYLLAGATQFVVEYAGDFLTQDVVGATTANAPDGTIDFTIDNAGTRHIRFYGMPRDVDGRVAYVSGGTTYYIPGHAAQTEIVSLPGALPDSNSLLVSTDTRPLADYVIAANGITVDTGFPFEKRLPGEYDTSDSVSGRDTIADYEQSYIDGDITDWTYLAAWGPGDFDGTLYPNTTHDSTFTSLAVPEGNLRPSLIRVIVQGIDSRERLEEPISMELIFRVPAE